MTIETPFDETPFDPDERRIEAMTEGSGFSRDLAEIKAGKKIVSGTTELPATPRPKRKPRRTGHVRDFESDRDHELAQMRAEYQPPSPDQSEITSRGRAAVEAALDETLGKDRHIQAIVDKVHQEIPIDPDDVAKSEQARERLINARLRTYFDNQK
jgi:hypothetical protein